MMINDTEEQAGAETVPTPLKFNLKIDFANFVLHGLRYEYEGLESKR